MKVLIADTHWLARKALKTLLESKAESVEVLEAERLFEALTLLQRHADFALLIVDLSATGVPPLAGLTALRAQRPGIPILVLLAADEGEVARRTLALGVEGCLPRSSSGPTILTALDRVMAGKRYRPDFVQADSGQPCRSGTALSSAQPDDDISGLTPRQLEILELLGEGTTNSEIASRLGLSVNTVRVHVHAVLKRLGLRHRTQAVLFAAARRQPPDESGRGIIDR